MTPQTETRLGIDDCARGFEVYTLTIRDTNSGKRVSRRSNGWYDTRQDAEVAVSHLMKHGDDRMRLEDRLALVAMSVLVVAVMAVVVV